MLKPKTRWVVDSIEQIMETNELISELKLAPVTASLLVKRGFSSVTHARSFLYENEQSLHDPYLLLGMDVAVTRIMTAIKNHEAILIFGDYDADGVTSTSVMIETLKELGARFDFYIPNRFTEGYGPNEAAFRHAHEQGVKLIITVDTGISAIHEAHIAKELGIDLIITDHHEPGPILPEAVAIIHPKHPQSTYPFHELAGVGVAFKLAHALLGRVPDHLLEFVAIGTIADLVPLVDENRLLVKKGLKRLRQTERRGIKALCKQAGINQQDIDEETVGFTLGPRLNAVGRLDSADPAVHLLLSEDAHEAAELASEIDAYNKERQRIVAEITEQAIKQVEEHYPIPENRVLVVAGEGWNAGVVGIVASRLVEMYYRPTIVLSIDGEKQQAKGSARSIEGFDLFKNLSTCREILPHFGGHPMAAGMTLELSNVDKLRHHLNQLAFEQLTDEDLLPRTMIDLELNVEDVNLKVIEELQLLAPFGTANKKPKVVLRDTKISMLKKIGANQNHLKLSMEANGVVLDGVGFHLGAKADDISPHAKLSVVGELSINEWNNMKKPQIMLHDLAVFETQIFDYRGQNRIEKLKSIVHQAKWLIFNEANYTNYKDQMGEGATLVSSQEEAKQMNLDGGSIVLVDLPPTKEWLYALLSGKSPERIYVYFYKQESDFFRTIPTRDHFKWYYGFLAKRGTFDLKRYGDELAKHRGWSRETIDFMSQVFFELEFVTINNGLITLNKVSKKSDLDESSTYQQKKHDLEMEQELLYSSYHSLKSWIDDALKGSAKNEEAIKEWI